MPSNQLPQATLGFLPSSQLGHTSSCYVFPLFSPMEYFPFCLVTMIYASMPLPGCDELVLIPIMYYVCISHGHFSYLRVCNLSGPFLSFKNFLSSYKNLAYEINLIFSWLMFSEALKLKFKLEKANNKFLLDLDKFQASFSPKDFNFNFSHDLKMNLDFKSIKFPAPYPSKLPIIKFPTISRIVLALLMGQSHHNTFRHPILQYKVQTLSVRLTLNLTSHGPEAIRSPAEYSTTLNLRLQNEANKPFKLIKFPTTARHTIIPPNFTYSKQGRVHCRPQLEHQRVHIPLFKMSMDFTQKN